MIQGKRSATQRPGVSRSVEDRARRELVDGLEDMISAHAPDGTYRYVSAAATRLLGYEPEEMIGTWAYDYFHPDDVAKVGVAHRNALKGAPFTVTYRLRRKTGGYVWVETTNKIVLADGGEVDEILCCTRGVAQRGGEAGAGDDFEKAQARVNQVLGDDAIEPHFQPIVEFEGRRTIAYEALARFPGDPSHTPDRWFGDAWEIGLGIPLELLAARVAARALADLAPEVDLHINASPATVAAPGFLSCLAGNAPRVSVEVTEHMRVDDYGELERELAALRAAGGKVAIDDFGAGYAGLRHLLRVAPETIKLDMSLTERLGDSDVARALTTSIVSFAREIGVRVIAEGIEDEDRIGLLLELGIEHGQGFHLGRPAPLEEVLAVG